MQRIQVWKDDKAIGQLVESKKGNDLIWAKMEQVSRPLMESVDPYVVYQIFCAFISEPQHLCKYLQNNDFPEGDYQIVIWNANRGGIDNEVKIEVEFGKV